MDSMRRPALVSTAKGRQSGSARARRVLETWGYSPLLSRLALPVIEARPPVDQADFSGRLMTLLAEAIGVDDVYTHGMIAPMVAIGLVRCRHWSVFVISRWEFDHEPAVADLLGGASIADVRAQPGTQSRCPYNWR